MLFPIAQERKKSEKQHPAEFKAFQMDVKKLQAVDSITSVSFNDF